MEDIFKNQISKNKNYNVSICTVLERTKWDSQKLSSENSHDLQLARWRPRRVKDPVPVQIRRQEKIDVPDKQKAEKVNTP